MSARPKIAVVGSFNTDLLVRTSRMPAPGETILGGPFYSGPGGKGANQAVAAARLGADVAMIVKLGQDAFGDQAYQNLANEGIDTGSVLRTQETHTGVAFIIVDDSGENLIVVAPGANSQLLPADIDTARRAITGADLLVLQLEIPFETMEYAVRLASDAGVRVLLNPAPGQALPDRLLSKLDYLTPNESEAQLVSGLPVNTPVEAEAAARALVGRGVRTVVVTLGARGALAVTGGQTLQIPGRTVKAVDTTGAGDAFNGAMAVRLAEGCGLEEAIRFANHAAALQVTRVGTAPAMPHREEVERFMAEVASHG